MDPAVRITIQECVPFLIPLERKTRSLSFKYDTGPPAARHVSIWF